MRRATKRRQQGRDEAPCPCVGRGIARHIPNSAAKISAHEALKPWAALPYVASTRAVRDGKSQEKLQEYGTAPYSPEPEAAPFRVTSSVAALPVPKGELQEKP